MSLYLTVHPFDDEWLWDALTNNEKPAVFAEIEAAVELARRAKDDYVALGVDADWETTFWSAIYDSVADPAKYAGSASRLVGFVDPGGGFHKCFDSLLVPTTPDGGFRND